MPTVFWKRCFAFMAFTGTLCLGALLFLLYNEIDGMRVRDEQRLASLQLLEELRTTTRTLTALARTRVAVGSTEAEKQFHQIVNVREGRALRPGSSTLQPGQLLSFGQMMDLQSFTKDEHQLLHNALEAFRILTSTEEKAMELVARVDVGNLSTPENRAVAREALGLLFGDEYSQQAAQVLRLLDNLGASFVARLGAEEDRARQWVAFLSMGLCVLFVVTGASFVGMGYTGHAGSAAKGRGLRFYIYIICALIVSLAVPIWLVYMDARNIMVGTLEKRQVLLCREVSRELNVRSGLALEVIRILSARPAVRKYVQWENEGLGQNSEVRAAALEVLESVTNGYTDTATTLLLNKDGMVLMSTLVGSALRKQYVLPEAELARLARGEAFITALRWPELGTLDLVVLSPVMGGESNAEFEGVVMSVLDKRNSFQLWEDRVATEERMNIFVLDKDGLAIMSSRGVDRQNKSMLASVTAMLAREGSQGLRYYKDGQGVERVGYFMPIPELGWTVGVSSAYASTVIQVNDMLVRAMIFGAVAIMLAIGFFTLLMQSMMRNLRLSNERMNSLVDGVGMYTWSYNEAANTYSYNPLWHKLMGLPGAPQGGVWTLEELYATVHEDDKHWVKDLLTSCNSGEYQYFEVRHFTMGGELRHVRVMALVEEVTSSGRIISGMAYDITPTKLMEQSEEKLRLNNERMTQLMGGAGIHTWEIDGRNNTLLYDMQWALNMRMPNPQAGEMPVHEFLGVVHPDFMGLLQELQSKKDLGQYVKFDLQLRCFSGDYIWHRSIARVVALNPDGNAVAYSGMGYDITAEKMLEESEELLRQQSTSLERANERMSNIMQATGMYMWEFDMPSNAFVYDAQWHRLMEMPGTPMGGVWTMEYMLSTAHPDDVVSSFAAMEQASEGGFLNFDARHITHTGKELWVRIMARVDQCGEDGKVSHMSGMGYDITTMKTRERSEAEYKQQLEELVAHRTAELEESRNQAEAASQAKTVFLSTVSHEIRTPMNAIVGFAHIFDRDNLTRVQKDQLDKIKLSAETLLGVINDVLDISKIEAGKLELERVAFPLHSMLDTVCSIVEFAAKNKGLELKVHVAEDVPARLMGDPKRISQILLNLLNNAVKFTAWGSVSLTVALEDAHYDKGVMTSPVTLSFRVTDTGIGLSDEQMSRLFQPFTQADSSVTRKYGGTGLGLAISKQLVELMGGSIGVTAELDKGSTFRFTICSDIPTGAEAEAGFDMGLRQPLNEQTQEQLQLLEGVRVLVVEDNEINQEIARGLLEEYRLMVDIADNGKIALEMAMKEEYACIFMDMQMPVMGGLEAASALRHLGAEAHAAGCAHSNLCWLQDVPIIAMTANAMSEDRQRCLEAGMDDHIGKPIDLVLLQKCLLRWVTPEDAG